MLLTTLRAVVLVGLLLAAGLSGGPGAPGGQPAKADENKPPAGPGRLLLAREGDLLALTLEGKEVEELTPPKGARSTLHGRLSPDGTRAAFVVNTGEPRGPTDDLDAPWPFQVVVRKLGAAKPTAIVDFSVKGWLAVCWSSDGKKVLATKDTGDKGAFEHVLLDADTGKTEPFALPADARVLDWSRDGKTFLTLSQKDKTYRLGIAARGDKEVRVLAELKVRLAHNVAARFSPDGKKVLFTDADPEQKDAFRWHQSSRPHVLDVATGKRAPLAEFPESARCLGVAWSPDGKRVAYTWVQLHPEVLKKEELTPGDAAVETEAFLIVADADGKNQKTVTSAKADSALKDIYGSIDWR